MNHKAVDRLTGAERAVEEIRARRAKLWECAGGTAEGYLNLIRRLSTKSTVTRNGKVSDNAVDSTASKNRSGARKRRAATPRPPKK